MTVFRRQSCGPNPTTCMEVCKGKSREEPPTAIVKIPLGT
jgi:hypothetical protein